MFPPISQAGASQQLRRDAFTLIELLVVISIIAVLMGLLFPAATNAQNAAKKATTKNQVVQIATAITAFETEYGRLPTITANNTSNNMNLAFVNILTGNDTTNNPRSLNFLDTSAWKTGKGGTNSSGYLDPWGNVYSVALDTNYSNILNLPTQPGGAGSSITSSNLTKHIGVYTEPLIGSKTTLIDSWE